MQRPRWLVPLAAIALLAACGDSPSSRPLPPDADDTGGLPDTGDDDTTTPPDADDDSTPDAGDDIETGNDPIDDPSDDPDDAADAADAADGDAADGDAADTDGGDVEPSPQPLTNSAAALGGAGEGRSARFSSALRIAPLSAGTATSPRYRATVGFASTLP